MASGLTFGNTSAPNNITTYLDSVFSSSLANYSKTLTDNIGASNAFIHELLAGDLYKSADGGTYITEQAMYALTPMDSYNGYDEMSTATTDGITQLAYDWRQMAAPISYNMLEVVQNQQRIFDLVDARIEQAEMGIQEGFAQAFMWGSGATGGALYTPKTSLVNGSLSIDPLPLLVSRDVTSSRKIGGLDQSLNAWWRNRTADSAATTYSGFMYELTNMYNLCSLGTGGAPTHILMDQITYQLFIHAYFSIFKANPDALDNSFPFVGKKFLNAKVIMDDKVPDYFSGTVGTLVAGSVDPTTMTYGSAIFLNSKTFKVRYYPGRDFVLLKDENGKSFVKPINGDSRVGQIGWMGNVTIRARRKNGVLCKIARTLT